MLSGKKLKMDVWTKEKGWSRLFIVHGGTRTEKVIFVFLNLSPLTSNPFGL